LIIRDVPPGHAIRIKAIGVAEDALRLLYEITPPINPRGWEDAIKDDAVQDIWLLSGIDSLGNLYASGGGAYGVVADGETTEGVHSLVPAPPPGAEWLDIAFHAAASEEPWERLRYVLRVSRLAVGST
jgi:hypothetical protein